MRCSTPSWWALASRFWRRGGAGVVRRRSSGAWAVIGLCLAACPSTLSFTPCKTSADCPTSFSCDKEQLCQAPDAGATTGGSSGPAGGTTGGTGTGATTGTACTVASTSPAPLYGSTIVASGGPSPQMLVAGGEVACSTSTAQLDGWELYTFSDGLYDGGT